MRYAAILLVSAGVGGVADVQVSAQSTPPLLSQLIAPDGRQPRFETAVVSENTSGNPPIGGTRLGSSGYVSAAKVTLRQLIQTAYRRHALDRRLIEGGPAWMDSELFNVDARAAGEHSLDADGVPRQSLLMLRTLLAEQFKLKVRGEVRDMPVYMLVRARSDGTLGPGLRRSDVDCAEAVALMIKGQRPKANCGFQQYVGRYVPSVLAPPDLASIFSESVDRPVLDRTGLSGHFYAMLEGAEIRPPGPFDAGYRPLDATREMFRAMPIELGLKLEAATAPVEVLVIEDAANPNKPDPLPLVVERAEVLQSDPVTGRADGISVSVHNTTDKTIVAWGVRTLLTFTGGETHGGGASTDGVENRGRGQKASSTLPPDGRYTIAQTSFPTNRTTAEVQSVTARATFIVFDDDTAVGDERSIAHLFERRAAQHRIWPVIHTTFLDAMARSSDPRDVFVAVDQALEAMTDQEVVSSTAYQHIQQSVKMRLRFPQDLERALENIVQEIQARRDAADAHYQRKAPR